MELMEYLASAVIVLVSNLCVEINKKISFLALSVWTDGLMSNSENNSIFTPIKICK